MSEILHRSHNVTVLLYHLVCVAKYRRVIVDESVDKALRDICLEIRHDLYRITSGSGYTDAKRMTLLK
jgi:REP element-mobilizing transposase RayT